MAFERPASECPTGSIVRWRSAFLRSIGWCSNVPKDGLVVGHSGRFISVQWCDAPKATLVNPVNVQLDMRATEAYRRMHG